MPRVDHHRALLVTVGGCLLIVGATLSPPYVYATLVASVPWLWEAVFLAAGATTLAWAAVPGSRLLFQTSGLLLLAGAISRGMALVLIAGQWPGVTWFIVAALAVWSWPRIRTELTTG